MEGVQCRQTLSDRWNEFSPVRAKALPRIVVVPWLRGEGVG